MLHLIIAESALELVPPEISEHPSVRNEARRREVGPSETLLDRSIHHHAMLRLEDDAKRGRPDLVHLTLLSITSTPLYQKGRVKVYIHTRGDLVLELRPLTRPPKSYSRFRDLVQKLLVERPGPGLITVYEASLSELLDKIGPDIAIGLSTQGKMTDLETLAVEISSDEEPRGAPGRISQGSLHAGDHRQARRDRQNPRGLAGRPHRRGATNLRDRAGADIPLSLRRHRNDA